MLRELFKPGRICLICREKFESPDQAPEAEDAGKTLGTKMPRKNTGKKAPRKRLI
jgi:hypothetical protein